MGLSVCSVQVSSLRLYSTLWTCPQVARRWRGGGAAVARRWHGGGGHVHSLCLCTLVLTLLVHYWCICGCQWCPGVFLCLSLPSSAFLCLLESYSGVPCHGPDHFLRYLIQLCRYRVLYSFWDSSKRQLYRPRTLGAGLSIAGSNV